MFRKTILASVAATFAASISLNAAAADNVSGAFDGMFDKSSFEQFAEDSSFDIQVRMNHFDLSPRRKKVNANFSTAEVAELGSTLLVVDKNELKGLITPLVTKAVEGAVPSAIPNRADIVKAQINLQLNQALQNDASIRQFVNANLNDPQALAELNKDLSNKLTKEVQDAADVRQGGVSLWTHFKSGYLFDFIGFDFGTQNAKVLYNLGSGTKIASTGRDGHLNKTMSRIAIANVKMRIGDEDRHIGLRKGKIQFDTAHFGRDKNEWLLDKNYEGAIINGKWDSLNVYGMEVTAFGAVNKQKFTKIKDKSDFKRAGFKKTNSLGARYESDYGNFWAATTWSKNYMRSNLIAAESGIPLNLLGMDVPTGEERNHMIVLSARHNWQKAQKDFVINNIHKPDHKATSSALMVGLKYDAWFAGMSYLKTSKEGFYDAGIGGGGQSEILANETLINDWNHPSQQTITGLITYDWKNFGFPGLSTNLISAHASNIDMKQVLKNGDVKYHLTGKDKFHETLVDTRYTWSKGPLKGLKMRVVAGGESNQATLKGLALFLTYNATLF